jgi:ABC-type amino acid transport substrate-binding protein
VKEVAMTKVARHRLLTYTAACCAVAAMAAPVASLGQRGEALEEGLELVDPNILRVCADPNNMPFSNEKGEGFENKIAELFAEKLGKRVAYTFYPQATGFVRMTLNSHRCDVIMGYPQGNDIVQNTNPYYQTAYAFVSKIGSPLETVDTLADTRLKDTRIGVVAGTPAATYLVTGAFARAPTRCNGA